MLQYQNIWEAGTGTTAPLLSTIPNYQSVRQERYFVRHLKDKLNDSRDNTLQPSGWIATLKLRDELGGAKTKGNASSESRCDFCFNCGHHRTLGPRFENARDVAERTGASHGGE